MSRLVSGNFLFIVLIYSFAFILMFPIFNNIIKFYNEGSKWCRSTRDNTQIIFI